MDRQRQATGGLVMTLAGQAGGGAESVFGRLALGLAKDGMTVSTVLRPQEPLLGQLQAGGLAVQTTGFGLRGDLATAWRLRRHLARRRPEVVIAFMQRAAAATPRGPYHLLGRLGGSYPLKRFRHCDGLIVPTPGLRQHCIDAGWPETRVWMLRNFLADRQGEALAPVMRPPGPLLLGLGRLHKVKGFDRLIAALVQLPDAHLWLAGKGPEEAALRSQAAALGVSDRVSFLGWQDDPLPLLRTADLLVVPSRAEPFGNVVLEAWMAGCPVLASATEGPSWLIGAGQSGALVAEEGAEAWAAAIAGLLANPRQRDALAQGGRHSYLKNFTEAGGIAAYRALFDRLHRAPRSGSQQDDRGPA
ncbi:MAG: glycosyltransferase [Pseudomonadota bacterium]